MGFDMILTSEQLRELFTADLEKSGLTPEDVPNWTLSDGREAKKYIGHGQDRAGYFIPYCDLDGQPLTVLSLIHI